MFRGPGRPWGWKQGLMGQWDRLPSWGNQVAKNIPVRVGAQEQGSLGAGASSWVFSTLGLPCEYVQTFARLGYPFLDQVNPNSTKLVHVMRGTNLDQAHRFLSNLRSLNSYMIGHSDQSNPSWINLNVTAVLVLRHLQFLLTKSALWKSIQQKPIQRGSQFKKLISSSILCAVCTWGVCRLAF